MLVTREAIREMRPVECELMADPEQDIVKALTTLTPGIPFLRASEDGLVDLRKGGRVDFILS